MPMPSLPLSFFSSDIFVIMAPKNRKRKRIETAAKSPKLVKIQPDSSNSEKAGAASSEAAPPVPSSSTDAFYSKSVATTSKGMCLGIFYNKVGIQVVKNVPFACA